MGANCVASASIGCLFCCKGCNAEKLRNGFTFIPPAASYRIESDPKDSSKGKMTYSFEALTGSALYRQAAEAAEIRWVKTRRDSQIPIVWFRHKDTSPSGGGSSGSEASPSSAEPPIVLLHCHGNATDIGMMMGPYYELSKILGIEVVGVEYSGYGMASGRASTGNCYADIEAAYDELVSLGVQPSRIVAYGQSVGSGPVSGLGVKKQLGGIILHSPLLSGIKVIDPEPEKCCRPSCVYTCFDFFPNDRRAQNFESPIFIMHGQRDEVVPFYHGLRLYNVCPKAYRWPAYFPERAGHNDIAETDMRAYFGEVSNFLQDVKRRANGIQVHPPSGGDPQQVEMAETSSFSGARSSSKDRRSASEAAGSEVSPSCRSQPPISRESRGVSVQKVGEAARHSGTSCDASGFIGSVPEVKAGPEDGRYQAVRSRGDIRLAAGNARDIQAVAPGGCANRDGARD